MRVSPRELRGISRDGLLVRFAMLGPVAFVQAEVPRGGSAGTGLELPTQTAAWGFILRGELTLHGEIERQMPEGTAFHVPAGPPDHWFTATGGTIVAGFAPVTPETDTSDQALRRQGFELLPVGAPHRPLPATIHPLDGGAVFRESGAIAVESTPMGEWLFASAQFGPLSGYTSGWCDLPHWGLVLRGDFALKGENDVELMSAGDVYYVPGGPPGHQFQVVDAANTIDYTPLSEFEGQRRVAEWRHASWRRLGLASSAALGAARSEARPDEHGSRLPRRVGAPALVPVGVRWVAPARVRPR